MSKAAPSESVKGTTAGPGSISTPKLINCVPLEQSYHKPMGMYSGGPLMLLHGDR